MGVGGSIILSITHMWKKKNELRILVLIVGQKNVSVMDSDYLRYCYKCSSSKFVYKWK